MSETTILQRDGITVTTARVSSGPSSYATQHISAIKTMHKPPARTFAFVIAFCAITIVIAGFRTQHAGTVAFGAIIAIASMLWLQAQKTIYAAVITTQAGTIAVYKSPDRKAVEEVAAAINQAVTSRA